MARVTVEDCVEKIPNRFNLVLLSAHRARSISAGSDLTIERDNDKNPVVALREIAENTVKADVLEENMIVGLQRVFPSDEEETDADRARLEDRSDPSSRAATEHDMLRALQSDRDGGTDSRI